MKNKIGPKKLKTSLSFINAVLFISAIIFCFTACEKDKVFIKSEANGQYLKSNHLGQVSFSANSPTGNYRLISQQ